MKNAVDLDGVLSKWLPTGYAATDNRPRSSYHLNARKLLKEVFPACQALEEVKIQIRRNEFLFVDFYIPRLDMMVEVQGEQHFQFSSHFHKSRMDFLMQKKRDREKAEWCALNNLQLVYLNYNEDIDVWRSKFKI